LKELLEGERAARDLGTYTAPSGRYSFRTYDGRAENFGDLKPSDVLMANLLSLKLSGADVTPLFTEGDGPAQTLLKALNNADRLLRNVNPIEVYPSASAYETEVGSLAQANEATELVHYWTPVTVSKVLHRRHPHVVPIIDSRVRRFYGVRGARDVRQALWNDLHENEERLGELSRPLRTLDGDPVSLLRAADIIIWMSFEYEDGAH
jgi:hypothetical protein